MTTRKSPQKKKKQEVGKGEGEGQLTAANSFWLRGTRGNTIERIHLYQNKILSRYWQGNFSALSAPWQTAKVRPINHLKTI